MSRCLTYPELRCSAVCAVYLHMSDLTAKCPQAGALVVDIVAVAPLPVGGGRRKAGALLMGRLLGRGQAMWVLWLQPPALPPRCLVVFLSGSWTPLPMSSEPEWAPRAGDGSSQRAGGLGLGAQGWRSQRQGLCMDFVELCVESRGPSPLRRSSHHRSCL